MMGPNPTKYVKIDPMTSSATDQDGSTNRGSSNSGGAVGRSFSILRVLRRSSAPLPLTAISDEIGIAPSSAHSVLMQLLAQNAVVQDGDKRYRLGPAMFYIGSAYARGSSLYRAAWSELITSANELGVTAALAVPWENHHLIISSHRAGDSDVSVPFGGRVPIDGGSWGKVHFAWSGDPLPAKLTSYTSASIVDRKAYAEEIETTRRNGYAVELGEFADDIGGVSAPVTSSAGYEGLGAYLAPLSRIEELTLPVIGRRIAGLTARSSLALGDSERVRFFGSEA